MSRFFRKSFNKSGVDSTNEGALKNANSYFQKLTLLLKETYKNYQLKYIKNEPFCLFSKLFL